MTDVPDRDLASEGSSDKNKTLHADDVIPNPRRQPPALVAAWSVEERAAKEKALVRKIDLRLMPMIIIMYMYDD